MLGNALAFGWIDVALGIGFVTGVLYAWEGGPHLPELIATATIITAARIIFGLWWRSRPQYRYDRRRRRL